MLRLHVPVLSTAWQFGLVQPDRLWIAALLIAGCMVASWLAHIALGGERRVISGAGGRIPRL